MYHAFVKREVRRLFEAVNRGDAEPVLRSFALRFEHVFPGDHALGGRRTSLEATREWYARLYRLLPDIRFDLREIRVGGGPWNTIVVAEWDEVNSGTDGVRTTNRGIHALHLRWGRATSLHICTDTAALETTWPGSPRAEIRKPALPPSSIEDMGTATIRPGPAFTYPLSGA